MSTMKLRPPAGRVRGEAPPPDPIVAATAPVYAAELRAPSMAAWFAAIWIRLSTIASGGTFGYFSLKYSALTSFTYWLSEKASSFTNQSPLCRSSSERYPTNSCNRSPHAEQSPSPPARQGWWIRFPLPLSMLQRLRPQLPLQAYLDVEEAGSQQPIQQLEADHEQQH